jgi:diaminohydroxyphosphoribosylaminopyrimidine deaminase/5-amino-6-(5-phosphoribosylamino)uracil reductase
MSHHLYMHRCLELAKLGAGYVAPNPMVGAVLVHEERIIGEGWHQQYGEPHAEVNAIRQAIQNGQTGKLKQSTLYVSLEPCAHHGKTPPCTDLIIQHEIPKVVIGCRDLFKEVDGKGIQKLEAAGVATEVGVLETECKELNKRFFTFHVQHRPYVVLKWAQTADGFITSPPTPLHKWRGGALETSGLESVSEIEKSSEVPPCGGFTGASRLLISNEYSNRLVHKWRSEEASILVGTNTAILDNPELTTRLWPGPSPVRLVVDMNLRLPSSLKIFDRHVRTIIFNTIKEGEDGNLLYFRVKHGVSLVQQIMNALYQLEIQSVLVEGGARLLQSFINEKLWDEVRTVTSSVLRVTSGLDAPVLANALKIEEQNILSDKIEIFKPMETD